MFEADNIFNNFYSLFWVCIRFSFIFLVSLKRQTILLLLINLFLFNAFISKFIYLYVFVGVKRVTWPPEHEYQARAASVTRQSPASQSQVSEHMHIFETISFSSSGRVLVSIKCTHFWNRMHSYWNTNDFLNLLKYFNGMHPHKRKLYCINLYSRPSSQSFNSLLHNYKRIERKFLLKLVKKIASHARYRWTSMIKITRVITK